MSPDQQQPPADDVRPVHAAREAVLSGGDVDAGVRDLIAQSWLRSRAAGVDAEHTRAPVLLDGGAVIDQRAAHPLSQVFPLLYDVLGRAAEACDSLMAVGDASGRLLWVCGAPQLRSRAEAIHFVEGASWDETVAGTNAPGTALRLGREIQIVGPEHYSVPVQHWSCAAAPIHDPVTGSVLGVVDVTGGPDVASPQTLAMVRAAARMAEAELGRLQLLAVAGRRPAPTKESAGLLISALGRPDCQLDDGTRVLRLSRRHSEILVVLADHPQGITSQQLALELYDDATLLSTVRAEIARVRALLGGGRLASRPYRLHGEIGCDWREVEQHLRAGRVVQAVQDYRGPLLPSSDAPGIVERRERLERALRAAVLAAGSVDLLASWTRTRWGADDLDAWSSQRALLPAGSPLSLVVDSELARLHGEYGLPGGSR